jgi:hypothetical protein
LYLEILAREGPQGNEAPSLLVFSGLRINRDAEIVTANASYSSPIAALSAGGRPHPRPPYRPSCSNAPKCPSSHARSGVAPPYPVPWALFPSAESALCSVVRCPSQLHTWCCPCYLEAAAARAGSPGSFVSAALVKF